MIHYSLICADGHAFDGWFRDSAAYDRQAEQGAVSCPACGSSQVAKAIMSPHVARPGAPAPAPDARDAALRAMVRDLRATIAAVTEDVGDAFPEEARRMREGEAEERPIRGRASFEEAKSLLEDGIEILPIPDAPGEGH
jgi:hypothetical protein